LSEVYYVSTIAMNKNAWKSSFAFDHIAKSDNEAKTLHVTLYHSMVVKLLEIVDSELDLQNCSDDDLTEVILDCPCIEVKYDNNSKVTELSSFDI
jgi:hypothetical protein